MAALIPCVTVIYGISIPLTMNIRDAAGQGVRRSVSALTVGALIQALRALPAELPVEVEGCDCFGDAGSVVLARGLSYYGGTIDRDAVIILRTTED